MIKLLRASATLGLLTLLVSACTTAPIATTTQLPPQWQNHEQRLAALQEWGINGKIGVRRDDRLDSAVINSWQQHGERFDISLSSTLFGLGATTLQGSPNGIWFTRSGKEPLYSDNPEQLVLEQVGWNLPIRQLLYWIKGIPAPDEINQVGFDEAGQLRTLEQSGWSIRYDDYLDTQPRLPRKLVLQRDQIRVTLIINEWQL